MIAAALLSLVVASAEPTCDFDAESAAAIDKTGAVFLGASAAPLAKDAAAALELNPKWTCAQQKELVQNAIDLWIREGSFLVERKNQQTLPVPRKFGAVKVAAPADVATVRLVYRGRETRVANGTVVFAGLGATELALYDGDRLLCNVSITLDAEREQTARCTNPDRRDEARGTSLVSPAAGDN